MDLSLYKDFPAGGIQAAVKDEMEEDMEPSGQGQEEVINLDADEADLVEEDEKTEEEKREEAEQKARDDEEMERVRLATAKQMAAYYEQLNSQL